MKIYFVDGPLTEYIFFTSKEHHACIDAGYGVSYCEDMLNLNKEYETNICIYTNSILAWNNKYVWNEELGVPEIYVIDKHDNSRWHRIDELTNRTLREEHNLLKLYLAGEFNQD